jgi:ATP-dependent Zn protease
MLRGNKEQGRAFTRNREEETMEEYKQLSNSEIRAILDKAHNRLDRLHLMANLDKLHRQGVEYHNIQSEICSEFQFIQDLAVILNNRE